jgi:acyl carrier protein
MEEQQNSIKIFRQIIADHLGLDPDDIHDDDRLVEDLHMRPPEITDVIETLSQHGFKARDLDLSEIETVTDLYESLNHELI